MTSPILLVEDAASLSLIYKTALAKAGNDVECAYTAAEAEAAHAARRHRVALLDLMLPDGDGLDVLAAMRAVDPEVKVIVITAHGSVNRAVEAMRAGAFDFLVKPFDDRRLLSAVENAVASLARDAALPAAPSRARDGFEGFVGSSPAMRRIYGMVESIGRSTATVFITGESGTGKEVCAQAIHAVSNRAGGPFVPLNCGAIPADLLESEVFGHLRGSFTGAIADKKGAAAAADGGTLFLDEICEMDLALQTKLLRFLQTSMITPVGATTARKVDARIVCATNRDPEAEVRAGRFREDLFYRLHVVPIALPPLRARGEDVVSIAESFLATVSKEERKRFHRLEPEVAKLFRRMRWPGNVRQLQNVIRNVVVLHDRETLSLDLLPAGLIDEAPQAARRAPEPPARDLRGRVAGLVGERLADVERELIEATIADCDGSVPQAARRLDVSPSTLYRKREAWAKAEA